MNLLLIILLVLAVYAEKIDVTVPGSVATLVCEPMLAEDETSENFKRHYVDSGSCFFMYEPVMYEPVGHSPTAIRQGLKWATSGATNNNRRFIYDPYFSMSTCVRSTQQEKSTGKAQN
jgi:hypothetical protein